MTTISDNAVSPTLLSTMNAKKAKGANSTDEAQNRFMTLLVTQMKNQDPLNPMDNAQVTSQLAQLSTVTGIDKLNTTLEALQGNYQSSQSVAATGMIGHGVLVPGSSLSLSAGKSIFGVELAEAADSVEITIRDAAGKAVQTLDLGGQAAGSVPLAWDGTTDAGKHAPDGRYTFDVTATSGNAKMTALTSLSFAEVKSVSTGSGGVKLNLPNMNPVNLADVRQIL